MSVTRDEFTRVVFTRGEAFPRPICVINICEDVNDTLLRGRYYGCQDAIYLAIDSLKAAGIALHGVVHLAPSEVGVDMSTAFERDLSVFVIHPRERGAADIYDIEEIYSSDILVRDGIATSTFCVSKRIVSYLGLGPHRLSVIDGLFCELGDLMV